MTVATEPDGRFRFASVPQEALVLVVTCKGFATVEKKLSPVAQDLTQLRIVLLPAPVSGTVTISATRTEMRISETAASAQFDDDQNLFRLRRYFTLDVFLSRRLGRGVEAFFAAENLFSQRYETSKTPVTTVGPPILLRVGFRLRLPAR